MRSHRLAGAALCALALSTPALSAELAPGSGVVLGTAAPGKATVRLDTAILTEVGFGGGTNDNALATSGTSQVTTKNNHYGIIMYARVYPAFDAQTPGGLRYGGFAEIRANNNTGGSNGNVGLASQRTTNTLYWNRAYGYLGGDSWGMLRFGMVDGAISLMKVGTFESFGDGGLNRSHLGIMPAPDSNIWRFPISVSSEYSSQKLSYTSPNFAGFDLGLSFAPSSATHQGSDGGTVVSGGSARGATSTLSSDANRYTNLFEAVGRYRATFGEVGVAANLGYLSSDGISVVGMPRQGLSIVDGGAQVSYRGFSFGGHVSSGTFNGTMNLAAPGSKTATVWLLGAQYETGQWLVGAHYMNATTPGSTSIPLPAALKEQGAAMGLNYVWAPGVKTFIEGVYVHRSQKGVDLREGNGYADRVNAYQVTIGQLFRW